MRHIPLNIPLSQTAAGSPGAPVNVSQYRDKAIHLEVDGGTFSIEGDPGTGTFTSLPSGTGLNADQFFPIAFAIERIRIATTMDASGSAAATLTALDSRTD